MSRKQRELCSHFGILPSRNPTPRWRSHRLLGILNIETSSLLDLVLVSCPRDVLQTNRSCWYLLIRWFWEQWSGWSDLCLLPEESLPPGVQVLDPTRGDEPGHSPASLSHDRHGPQEWRRGSLQPSEELQQTKSSGQIYLHF